MIKTALKLTGTVILTVFCLISLLITIIVVAMPSEEELNQQIDEIHETVAKDTEWQYYQAVEHGNIIDQCVRAGLVAESYLQSGNSAKYATWMNTRDEVCKSAGLPY